MAKYDQMTVQELEGIVRDASAALAAKKEARRAELLAELETLGGVPAPASVQRVRTRAPRAEGEPVADGRSKTPQPKYESHREPGLTWSGRGQRAKWLAAEMEETGKPIEAFLIKR